MSIHDAAKAMIRRNGARVLLTRTPVGGYSAATSAVTGESESHTVTAAAFPFGDKLIDGTRIQSGDMQVFMLPSTAHPIPDDVLELSGVPHIVISSKAWAANGRVAYYEVHARRVGQ